MIISNVYVIKWVMTGVIIIIIIIIIIVFFVVVFLYYLYFYWHNISIVKISQPCQGRNY